MGSLMPSFDEEISSLKNEMFLAEEAALSFKRQATEAERYAKECKVKIINIMKESGVITVISEYHKITLKKTAASVIIEDESLLLPDYFQEEVKLTPNNDLIKIALKDGYEVPGAKLSEGGVTLQFTAINKR